MGFDLEAIKNYRNITRSFENNIMELCIFLVGDSKKGYTAHPEIPSHWYQPPYYSGFVIKDTYVAIKISSSFGYDGAETVTVNAPFEWLTDLGIPVYLEWLDSQVKKKIDAGSQYDV